MVFIVRSEILCWVMTNTPDSDIAVSSNSNQINIFSFEQML